jgi:hypothetical protein
MPNSGCACGTALVAIMVLDMTSKQTSERKGTPGRGGRPSKGDRVGLMVRVPRDLAALFAQEAAAAGLSQSDRMTEILVSLYYGSCSS